MEFTCDTKAMHAFLVGLPESELVKVTDWKYANEIWDAINRYYEGDSKVKKDNLQGFRIKFESLSMHDYEDIAKYFQRVDEVVNTIRGLDEKLDEDVVAKKVLKFLPKRINLVGL